MSKVDITATGKVFVGGTYLGTVAEVPTDDGGRVWEARSASGVTAVRRFSEGGAAHALAEALTGDHG